MFAIDFWHSCCILTCLIVRKPGPSSVHCTGLLREHWTACLHQDQEHSLLSSAAGPPSPRPHSQEQGRLHPLCCCSGGQGQRCGQGHLTERTQCSRTGTRNTCAFMCTSTMYRHMYYMYIDVNRLDTNNLYVLQENSTVSLSFHFYWN